MSQTIEERLRLADAPRPPRPKMATRVSTSGGGDDDHHVEQEGGGPLAGVGQLEPQIDALRRDQRRRDQRGDGAFEPSPSPHLRGR